MKVPREETSIPSLPDALALVPAFARLAPEQLRILAAHAELLHLRPGQVAHDATAFYLVLDGRSRLVGDSSGRQPLDTLVKGGFFNEGALFGDGPSRLSLEAETPSIVWCLTPVQFTRLAEKHREFAAIVQAEMLARDVRSFLENSTVFEVLPPEALWRLRQALTSREIPAGELLIREGERAEDIYPLSRGELRVFRHGAPEKTIARLKPGSIVGEVAVLTGSLRTADVIAETSCRLLALPAGEFLDLLSEQKPLASAFESLVRERLEALDGANAARSGAVHNEERKEKQPESELPGPDVIEWSDTVIGPDRRGISRFFPSGITLQQSEMDCGAACLSTICRHYGRSLNLNVVRGLTKVRQSGSSMFDLKNAAELLGFETHAYRQGFRDLCANHLPAIINWRGYHWVVVQKIKDSTVTLADPGMGRVKLNRQEFEAQWTGYVLYLRPTVRFLRLESSSPSLKPFLPFFRPYRNAVLLAGVAALCVQLLQLLVPLLSKFIIDDVVMKKNGRWLVPAIIGVLAGTAARIGVSILRQRLLMYASANASIELVRRFLMRLLALPISFFESRRTGDILSRMEENNYIGHIFAGRGLEILIDIFGAVIAICAMLWLTWKLTLVAVLAILLHVINLVVVSPRLRQGFRVYSQRVAETDSHLVESIGGLHTVRVLGIHRYVRWTYENLLARQSNAHLATLRLGIVSGLARTFVSRFGSLAVLFWGAYLVLNDEMTIGSLVAFTGLMGSLFGPVLSVVGFWDELQHLLVSAERIADVSENKPEPGSIRSPDRLELPQLQGRLRLSSVSFRYDPQARDVLQNIDLEINPGQTVAFVGRSGSGKTTMIKLLLGFHRPTRGAIMVDGFELDKVWLPSLRRQVGMVPQDAHLFRDTVRANISLASPDCSLGEVIEAAKRAGAHEFITALPKAYETVLEERGSNLSGGQRQRIAIARAILQNPRMLVLDEASSALDNESERFFLQNVREHFAGRTVLMIAHRLSTVRHADVIVVLDRGVVIERGNHEELMARRGLYFMLATQRLQV